MSRSRSLGIGAGQLAQPVLALELVGAQPIRPVALGHAPLHAVGVHDDPRHPLAILGVDARGPQIGGLVDVGVGRDDEVLLRIAGARGARPARVAGRVQAPAGSGSLMTSSVVLMRVLLHCTSVNGGVGVVVGLEHRLHRRADR